jgi:hypothetical protein
MKRRAFITLLSGAAVAWPLAAYAQQSKAPRIGALVLTDQDGRAFGKALREGLRELGLIEGQNYALELRSADAGRSTSGVGARVGSSQGRCHRGHLHTMRLGGEAGDAGDSHFRDCR